MNNGKAADENGISSEHFKYAKDELTPILVDIVNDIFKNLDVPNPMKCGILNPIHKKGKDKFLTDNYRGIVISDTFAKILEIILKNRLDKIFNTIQHPLQRGFTEKTSSMNAAFIISEAMEHHRELNKPLLLATLDAQKAFDRVNHEILFNKLYHIGVQGPLWLLLRNLYRQSTVKVKWEGQLSNEFELKQGTKQGAQLSTTLYKIYHNDLLKSVSQSTLGASIGNINVSTPTCADDTALLANSPHELQAMLDLVEFNTSRDLVKINPDKSEILTVKYKNTVKATLNGQEISNVSNVKHLGIDRNGKNTVNIEERLRTAQRTIYSLLGPGLHARRGFSPIVAHKIWNTYVTPKIPIWD